MSSIPYRIAWRSALAYLSFMPPRDHLSAIWLAIIFLASLIFGVIGGSLAAMGGASPPDAVLTGGGTFAVVATLLLGVYGTLR